MSDFPELVEALRSALPKELQETILFYVGDVVLYFAFFGKPGNRIEDLVTQQGGAGFALEEAIKSGHKPLVRWLLTAIVCPIDYILASAACYGDLDVLSYLTSLIGEGYKEYDTPAKLLCLLKGKLNMLEFLFEENPTMPEGKHWAQCIHACLLVGISTSSEMYIWYMRNQHILPTISIEDRIKACIQNDNVPDALELVGGQNPIRLLRVLIAVPLGSEATYRELMLHYASEMNVLIMIARACARLGYVSTLEILFNEPYNVHVEYDFFVDIPNLAVVKTLHEYASQRNTISSLLDKGWIQTAQNRLGPYQTPVCYLELLMTFTESDEGLNRRHYSCWAGQQSEDVLLFLVDLAEVTSSVHLVKKYILYGIECGHLRLLRKLVPLVKKSVLRNITQRRAKKKFERRDRELETEYPYVYQSERPELVEYLFELGISQPVDLNSVLQRFDLKFVQSLVERGLVIEDSSDTLVEWDWGTQIHVLELYSLNIRRSCEHAHQSEKRIFMEFMHLTSDMLPYRKNHYSRESHPDSPVSVSLYDGFSCRISKTCHLDLNSAQTWHLYWSKYPNLMISTVELAIREVNQCLLFDSDYD
ncbi:hypothetical protein K493DRAFT_303296 [Basidiobolus meristosporus CBS 931.73]|uniref:Uncharacterized protein n=1 Tax=Basidiobolus meristosporus CBS 931.73 TaxID=1314790 RepID=A0A1Y1Y3A7_9FUNG|nr:hypothetical protein K493DRAFT_303296 [Basidiobolus meristosporus CBS 931.73]|eukprot:ORX92487.1 hypothetical protein K493DRAFT_303296 [Basidiobolus meristosporus CBS 931.73]